MAASSNNAAAASVGAKLVACLPAGGASQQANVLLSSPQLQLKQSMVSSSGAAVSTSRPAQAASSSTATVTHTSNGQVASITHITPNINQLLPSNALLFVFAVLFDCVYFMHPYLWFVEVRQAHIRARLIRVNFLATGASAY